MATNLLPNIIEAGSLRDLSTWFSDYRQTVDEALDRNGAVLFRGFDIRTEGQFGEFVRDYSKDVLEYVNRSTPRTDVGKGIYTASEYPAGLTIPQHNENAYQRDWPLRLLFFCMQPADQGGETPLADCRRVTKRISPIIGNKFYEKNIMYIRNYRDGIDIPWRVAFQTESKVAVEQYCKNHDIHFEWTGEATLRTKQICQAFAKHPRTGSRIWFNQAHLFHPSALDLQTRRILLDRFDKVDFPRNVTFGDGSSIEEAELEIIREAYRSETVSFKWRTGDLLIVDNMLVSHGRTPFKGDRRVLVAMCERCSSNASTRP
jgi:alpha-ketoglutarate-dependent taurine dioxygenase